MTEERRICVKQILDKAVSVTYKSALYCIVFALICGIAFFSYIHIIKNMCIKKIACKTDIKKNGVIRLGKNCWN